MGSNQNRRLEEHDRRAAAKAAKASRRVERADSGGADWGDANPTLLADCVARVARQGGALRFGYTRDGGAFSVGVYGDGDEPYTQYIRPSEDIDAYLHELVKQWDDGKV